LFVDAEGEVTDLAAYKEFNCVDGARIVFADWPAEEDEARLGPVREGMRAGAIEHARIEVRGLEGRGTG